MHMQSPPVNSLSLEFLTDVCIALEKLEMDKSCRGLVVTSVQLKQLCADGLTSVLQWSLSCLQFHSWSLNMLSIMTVYPAGLASGCVLPWNPEPAQGVLSRAGHLGHVWEESRALCGVLESCARDVAQVLWLQHDHYSSSQCTYRTTQHLPPHCLHLTRTGWCILGGKHTEISLWASRYSSPRAPVLQEAACCRWHVTTE